MKCIFSGQMEVHQLIKKLERKYPPNTKNEPNLKKNSKKKKKSFNKNIECDDEMTLDYDEFGIYDMDQTDFGDENLELDQQNEEMMKIDELTTFPPLFCLPLYSMLPSHLQKRVFLPTPEDGSRICIVN
jgi:HrpA-like RNA helicase